MPQCLHCGINILKLLNENSFAPRKIRPTRDALRLQDNPSSEGGLANPLDGAASIARLSMQKELDEQPGLLSRLEERHKTLDSVTMKILKAQQAMQAPESAESEEELASFADELAYQELQIGLRSDSESDDDF